MAVASTRSATVKRSDVSGGLRPTRDQLRVVTWKRASIVARGDGSNGVGGGSAEPEVRRGVMFTVTR